MSSLAVLINNTGATTIVTRLANGYQTLRTSVRLTIDTNTCNIPLDTMHPNVTAFITVLLATKISGGL